MTRIGPPSRHRGASTAEGGPLPTLRWALLTILSISVLAGCAATPGDSAATPAPAAVARAFVSPRPTATPIPTPNLAADWATCTDQLGRFQASLARLIATAKTVSLDVVRSAVEDIDVASANVHRADLGPACLVAADIAFEALKDLRLGMYAWQACEEKNASKDAKASCIDRDAKDVVGLAFINAVESSKAVAAIRTGVPYSPPTYADSHADQVKTYPKLGSETWAAFAPPLDPIPTKQGDKWFVLVPDSIVSIAIKGQDEPWLATINTVPPSTDPVYRVVGTDGSPVYTASNLIGSGANAKAPRVDPLSYVGLPPAKDLPRGARLMLLLQAIVDTPTGEAAFMWGGVNFYCWWTGGDSAAPRFGELREGVKPSCQEGA